MNKVTLREALPVWWRIGILSFGGPTAQIALMHKVIVDERGWLTERDYLNALSFCMLLPGPEAMQLATYTGWRLQGVAGGLLAGLLFVLPGAAIILGFAIFYTLFGNTPALASIFIGVKAAVLVIVFEALLRVARKGLDGGAHWVIAALSFIALFFLGLPFPLIILTAGLYGFVTARPDTPGASPVIRAPWQQTLRTILVWGAIWAAPILAVIALGGPEILGALGIFFSKLATVTFGGAYAVLAYMAQDAVENQGWLTAAEMVDGLGLAETTPGPLILVTEFVGFLAGARADGAVNIGLGIAAAGMTLWATFAPCFLWVFAGAPYIEWITSKPRLRAALGAISAAVVGVILNLSLWFALHVLFHEVDSIAWGPLTLLRPDLTSANLLALGLVPVAAYLLLFLKRGILVTLSLCGAFSYLAGLA